ncbi:MAG TPA: hypothetical protein VNI01_13105, partial [Elusimicrobiota bacterium]|nr:hypothetical protein [Elusimicrobiota bacterium]
PKPTAEQAARKAAGLCTACGLRPPRTVSFTDEHGQPATLTGETCLECQRGAFAAVAACEPAFARLDYTDDKAPLPTWQPTSASAAVALAALRAEPLVTSVDVDEDGDALGMLLAGRTNTATVSAIRDADAAHAAEMRRAS